MKERKSTQIIAGGFTGNQSFFKPNSIGKNKNMSFRINGSFEKGNSFRDFVHSERSYINPSFLIKLSDKTELLLEADYIKYHRTPDFGAGIYNFLSKLVIYFLFIKKFT